MHIAPCTKKNFAPALLAWFAANRRALPWRASYAPYPTWIAEVMMQQTQMERGVAYFNRWMDRFPDVASVAEASEETLLKYWEGLGYYRRARNIQAAARRILRDHGGRFPADLESIRALPGIGEYTAAAIASTAFEQDVACVDGNVERVLSRVFDLDMPLKQGPGKKTVRELAQALLPAGRARDFNQGLMELGALVCRKKPDCQACPLQNLCEARRLDIVEHRPVAASKAPVTHAVVVAGVLRVGGRVFVQRRLPDDRVWAGLWEFPGGMVEDGEQPAEAVVREFMEEVAFQVRVLRPLGLIRHSYTTYRLSLHCFELALEGTVDGAMDGAVASPPQPVLHEACDWKWATAGELDNLPLPASHRKLADRYDWGSSA